MKKLSLLFSVAAMIVLLPSCKKKDYNCTCSYGTGIAAPSYSSVLTHMKKKDAAAACKEMGGPASVSGVTTTIVCRLD